MEHTPIAIYLAQQLEDTPPSDGSCQLLMYNAASELKNQHKVIESLRSQLASMTKERDELAKALSKYGHHIEGCGNGWSCECGFYSALAKVGGE